MKYKRIAHFRPHGGTFDANYKWLLLTSWWRWQSRRYRGWRCADSIVQCFSILHFEDKDNNFLLYLIINPCFSGRWSLSPNGKEAREAFRKVLILVLVEDGLWGSWVRWNWSWCVCLNPCFSGRWSLSVLSFWDSVLQIGVLILVLVEDGLWEVCISWYA